MKALINATLIDGTGVDPASGATVLIGDDGRIAGAGVNVAVPRDTEVIDVSGRTAMPGLIDCHVHLLISGPSVSELVTTPPSLNMVRAVKNAEATLDAGVTSARDLAGVPLGFKMAAEQGLIPSPRLKIAIMILTQTGVTAISRWRVACVRVLEDTAPSGRSGLSMARTRSERPCEPHSVPEPT